MQKYEYTERKMPSETCIRRQVRTICDNCILNIQNAIKDRNIWMSIDDTTDATGRYVANVVIRILDSKEKFAKKILLLRSLQVPPAPQ